MGFSGKRLQLCRQRSGMSQAVAAKELGISDSSYRHYEHGINGPSNGVLCKICILFNVSADYLLGLTDEMVGYER